MNKEAELVEVYSANGDLEAQVIKGLLESHGITCLLQPYAESSLHNIIVPGLSIVKVMVAARDAENAIGLIMAENDTEQ